jgi:EAL domain-containing protein (putative c-di-GMP-specific phosphodiesterase class I)
MAILEDLTGMGIRFAIDDFGTGYSSLSVLKRLPLCALKIDRSFVQDMETNADDQAIVRAIIGMAHTLKLRVIAEGVERRDQLDSLRKEQCDDVQGFLISPPKPAEQITPLLGRKLFA